MVVRMSGNRNGKDNFIMQAGILAVAGIVSRVIGLLYRGPLKSVIGDLGLGYYQTAYEFYTIVLLISSYSIPSAISKVIAQKLALREYRNAHKIFLCSLGYVLAVGTVASLFLYFGAGLLVAPEAIPVLRTFAPTIFIYGILGVLRGYFQAHKSMAQSSISQILEQIANAAVSLGASYLLINSMMGNMDIPQDAEGQIARATYGAIGSATGTGMGVLFALLFMLCMYLLNKEMIHRRIKRDRHRTTDSYGQILKTITMVVTPFIISTAIYNMSGSVNTKIYQEILPRIKEIDTVTLFTNWSAFSGQALTIANIPVALATAMAAAIIPTVAQLVAANEMEGAKRKMSMAIKCITIITIPSAVGLFVLAKPVTSLLFQNTEEVITLAARLLMTMAPSVVFFSVSTLSNTILQGLGKLNAPIINAGVALVVQSVTAVLLLLFTDLDIYSIAVANIVYAVTMCILNQISLYRAVGYRQELYAPFLIPIIASGFMGAVAWAVYEGMYMLTSSMRISVIPAILAAVPVYFAMLLIMKGVTEQELRSFPKGTLLVRIAKKCRLMK